MAVFSQSFAIKAHTKNTMHVRQVSDATIKSTPQRTAKSYAMVTWNLGIVTQSTNVSQTQFEITFPVYSKNNLTDINTYFKMGNEFDISIQIDSTNQIESPDHLELVVTHQPEPLFSGANPFLSETEQQNQIKPPMKYWSIVPENTNFPDTEFAQYVKNAYDSLTPDPIDFLKNDDQKLVDIAKQISEKTVVIFNEVLSETDMQNTFGINWSTRLIGIVADPRMNYKTLKTADTTRYLWTMKYDTSVHKFIAPDKK